MTCKDCDYQRYLRGVPYCIYHECYTELEDKACASAQISNKSRVTNNEKEEA